MIRTLLLSLGASSLFLLGTASAQFSCSEGECYRPSYGCSSNFSYRGFSGYKSYGGYGDCRSNSDCYQSPSTSTSTTSLPRNISNDATLLLSYLENGRALESQLLSAAFLLDRIGDAEGAEQVRVIAETHASLSDEVFAMLQAYSRNPNLDLGAYVAELQARIVPQVPAPTEEGQAPQAPNPPSELTPSPLVPEQPKGSSPQ